MGAKNQLNSRRPPSSDYGVAVLLKIQNALYLDAGLDTSKEKNTHCSRLELSLE